MSFSTASGTGSTSVTILRDEAGLAKETGGNLAAIKAGTDKIPAKGSANMENSMPVTLATNDPAQTNLAAIKLDVDKLPNDPAREGGNILAIKNSVANIPAKGGNTKANATPVTIATDDAANTNLAAVKVNTDKIPAKGSANMADSMPVTLATNDPAQTSLASIKIDVDKLPDDPAREGGNLLVIKNSVANIPAKGGTTKANATPITIATDDALLTNTAKLDANISTLAKESGGNLAIVATKTTSIDNKLQAQAPAIFNIDLPTTTTAAQLNANTAYRTEITILADIENTDSILIGGSAAQTFPLVAGASITLRAVQLSAVYAKAHSGNQLLHVIAGGI
jgi:hypothetical protein